MRASLGFGAGQCFEVGSEGATDEETADFSFRSDAVKDFEELFAVALLGGFPEMTGARFVTCALTVIENGPSEALEARSLTVMVTPEYVPTLAALGVP